MVNVKVTVNWADETVTVDGDTFALWDTDSEGNKVFLLPGTSFRPVYYLIKKGDQIVLHSEHIIKNTGERRVFEEIVSREFAEKLIKQVFRGEL